jgi:hypothetical protein
MCRPRDELVFRYVRPNEIRDHARRVRVLGGCDLGHRLGHPKNRKVATPHPPAGSATAGVGFDFPADRMRGMMSRKVRIVALAVGVLAILASSICCWATQDRPGRCIFIPAGDVGLGFRSWGGWLEWIEYEGWEPDKTDYVRLSVLWWAILLAEIVFCLAVLFRLVFRHRPD